MPVRYDGFFHELRFVWSWLRKSFEGKIPKLVTHEIGVRLPLQSKLRSTERGRTPNHAATIRLYVNKYGL
ncbi:hypothetical protein SAMN04488244_101354 [Vibrio hangzhouensis]|uniref:Uncharacterized protein n=1 Tax=Vibrio hangzhouensis TaxID=462991 RepID=A0A1H5SG36_9VIBR|nr:hypothetical protein SAMN04488244_101354 [Vibrio hangzhouensis]